MANNWDQFAEWQEMTGHKGPAPSVAPAVAADSASTSLEGATSMDLVQQLRGVLADAVSLYFRAQGYHWNVEGPDFSQYHALFGEVYSDIYGSIDPIAENIRKLGAYAPFTLAGFVAARSIDDSRVSTNPKAMAEDLLSANEKFVKVLNAAFAVANSEDQQGVANFLAERIDQHQKWSWQLRSSVK